MMRAYAIVRPAAILASVCLGFSLSAVAALGQDVGGEVGGGAGIFRAKNPETKKTPKTTTTTGTKPANRTGTTRPKAPSVEDKVEDLLESGNVFRDARKFTEAEEAYQGVFKLKPHDARAAYGLGNVYSDQQRWDDAEASYRDA